MEATDLTIKRTYDKYDTKDFTYGAEDSVNLNPKREINFDQLDRIVVKLQEVTDDIIRKRIQPPPLPVDKIRAALGGESIPMGIPLPKQQLLAQTGSIGNALLFPVIETGTVLGPIDSLLERMVGLFPIPELLDDLDSPIKLDCDLILQQFEFDDAEEYDDEEDDEMGETPKPNGFAPCPNHPEIDTQNEPCPLCGESGEPSEPEESEDDDEEEEEDEDEEGDEEDEEEEDDEVTKEMKECAEIELTWLKILLILVKIIKILKMIVDLVLSIVIPLLEILRLAVGAWINPPNIPSIVQRIIELVTAIIIMILALIIQLIWNLLNLDCFSDQTASIIEQIRRAMSMFSSLMNAFNPTAVNMLANKLNKEVMDPLNSILEEAMKKKESWANIGQQMKDQLDIITSADFKEKMMAQMKADITAGMLNTPQAGKMAGVIAQTRDLINGPMQDALKSMADVKAGYEALTSMKIKQQPGGKLAVMLGHPSLDIGGTT